MRQFKGPSKQRGFVQFFAWIWNGIVAIGGWIAGSQFGQALAAIAFNLLSMALTKRPGIESPRLDNLEYGGSSYDRVIPIVYGEARIMGNVTLAAPISEDKRTKKVGGFLGIGGQKYTEWFYNGTFQVVFCRGPKRIVKIWFNEELVYDTDDSNTVVKNKHTECIYPFTGTATQDLPSPALADGNIWPANRDLCYVHVHNLPLKDYGNRIPAVNAVVADVDDKTTYYAIDDGVGATQNIRHRIMCTGPYDPSGSRYYFYSTSYPRFTVIDVTNNKKALDIYRSGFVNGTGALAAHHAVGSDGRYFCGAWEDGSGNNGVLEYDFATQQVHERTVINYTPFAIEVGNQFIITTISASYSLATAPLLGFSFLMKGDASDTYYATVTNGFFISNSTVLAVDREDRVYMAQAANKALLTLTNIQYDTPSAAYSTITTAEAHELAVGDRVWIYNITDGNYDNDFEGHWTVAGITDSYKFYITKSIVSLPAFSGSGQVYTVYQDRMRLRRFLPSVAQDFTVTGTVDKEWDIEFGFRIDNWNEGLLMRWSEQMQALVVHQAVATANIATIPTLIRLDYDEDTDNFSYSSTTGFAYSSAALPIWYGKYSSLEPGNFAAKLTTVWENWFGSHEVFIPSSSNSGRDAVGVDLRTMTRFYPEDGAHATNTMRISSASAYPGVPLQTSHDMMWYFESIGYLVNSYYTQGQWAFKIKGTSTVPTNLQSIVSSMCVEAGFAASDYSVSGIATTKIHGMVIDQENGLSTYAGFLSEVFQFHAVDSDWRLKFADYDASTVVASVATGDLRATAGGAGNSNAHLAEVFMQEEEIPYHIEITYTERQANWMKNTIYAKRHDDAVNSRDIKKLDLNMNVSAGLAMVLAEKTLQRVWTQRSRFDFSLPYKYLEVEPGDSIVVQDNNSVAHSMFVRSMNIRTDFVLDVEGESNNIAEYRTDVTFTGAYTSGYPQVAAKIPGMLIPVVFQIPALNDDDATDPVLYFAADTWDPEGGWVGAELEYWSDTDVEWQAKAQFFTKSVLGATITTLQRVGHPWMWDRENTVTVQVYGSAVLSSVSEEAVYGGSNWALIQNSTSENDYEIIGFQTATDQGGGQYKLSNLLRGLRGTENLSGYSLARGSIFALLNDNYGTWIYASSLVGTKVTTRIIAYDTDQDPTPFVVSTMLGKSMSTLGPSPVIAERKANGDIRIQWYRRDKTKNGWESNQDVANSESAEQYQIEIKSSTGLTTYQTVSTNALSTTYTSAQQFSDYGSTYPHATLRIIAWQLTGNTNSGKGTPSYPVYVSAY